jgi:hypothetical protein
MTGFETPTLARHPGAGLRVSWIFGRMLMLPWTLLTYSLETMLLTMRQLEESTGRSTAGAPASGATSAPSAPREQLPAAAPPTPYRQETANPPTFARETNMSDTSLSDDLVKLVRYTIVNIERDREAIVGRGEEIVTDNLSDDAFASWMIAKHVPLDSYKGKNGWGEDDARKSLRVCYEVLGRWPKQDRKYEKRQLEILEGIKEALVKG